MSVPSDSRSSVPSGKGNFEATHWSLVLAAARSSSTPQSREALEKLCRTYWPPLYAFVRKVGHEVHDSQDLTQAFFARLLEKHALGTVHPSKGKFRSFLLASLKNFLANEWDKTQARKRGGGVVFIPIDGPSTETHCGGVDPSHEETADKIYDRQWALTLLDEVLKKLREAYVTDGREKIFECLKETLTAGKTLGGYAALGQELGMSEGAVKVAVHRLRQRYRELLRAEIAQTVSGPEEVDDELRELFAALSA
jgi:RNA polymerase sigma factor (sigma-70 family)